MYNIYISNTIQNSERLVSPDLSQFWKQFIAPLGVGVYLCTLRSRLYAYRQPDKATVFRFLQRKGTYYRALRAHSGEK